MSIPQKVRVEKMDPTGGYVLVTPKSYVGAQVLAVRKVAYAWNTYALALRWGETAEDRPEETILLAGHDLVTVIDAPFVGLE